MDTEEGEHQPLIRNAEYGSIIEQKPAPIAFSWNNITVRQTQSSQTVQRDSNRPGEIVSDASGQAAPGDLLAILGSSGAGKTSLLNALTFRNLAGLQVTGSRYVNQELVTPNSITSISAYVQQDDLFMGTLTVREHLVFQAMARMRHHLR